MIFRHFKKQLFLCLGFLGFSLLSTNALTAQQSVSAAAFVNDDVITIVDVISRTNLALVGNQEADPGLRRRIQSLVLDNLINESIQRQEAERLGLDLPSNEVNAAAARIANQNGKNLSQFLSELEQEGVTRPTLLSQVKAQLSWQILVGRRFRSSVDVTDDDIAEVRREFARNANLKERLLSEIYLPFDRNQPQNQTLANAQALLEQIKGGKSFAFTAQQFSQAPSAVDGGDLGWTQEGTLDPRIEQALAATAEGDVTDLITTDDGVYLFGFRGTRPVGKRNVGQKVRIFQLFFTLPEDVNSIPAQQKLARAAAIIQSVEGCDQFAKAISEFGEPGSGDMGFVEPQTLPADLGNIALRIEEGRVTPPFPVPNGAALFMVCGKQQVTEDVTDDEIRDNLLEERLQSFAKRYLRELKGRAFIDVRLR